MSDKFDEIKPELIEFLKENLSLDVDEKSHGFNGRHLNFKLSLGETVLSEEFHEIQRDDG